MDVRRQQPLKGQIWWVFMLRSVRTAVLILMGVRIEAIPPSDPTR